MKVEQIINKMIKDVTLASIFIDANSIKEYKKNR